MSVPIQIEQNTCIVPNLATRELPTALKRKEEMGWLSVIESFYVNYDAKRPL